MRLMVVPRNGDQGNKPVDDHDRQWISLGQFRPHDNSRWTSKGIRRDELLWQHSDALLFLVNLYDKPDLLNISPSYRKE